MNLDEPVVTNDAWPTPDSHSHLLPRDESIAARWWRVVLSFWRMWR